MVDGAKKLCYTVRARLEKGAEYLPHGYRTNGCLTQRYHPPYAE